MRNKYLVYALAALYATVLTILSYLLQMYQFTSLEEVHIMLYDSHHISAVLSHPGGVAQIVASLCSQMFICRYAGPLIMGIVYWLIITLLTQAGTLCYVTRVDASGVTTVKPDHAPASIPLWLGAVTTVPCYCLMLCLENSSYMLQGTMAMLLCAAALWLYTIVMRHADKERHLYTFGILLNIFMYWVAGSVTIALAICCMIITIGTTHGHRLEATSTSLAYLIAACFMAYLYYRFVPNYNLDNFDQAFTPAMYYDMGSTYYMYFYSMVALIGYVLLVAIVNSRSVHKTQDKSQKSSSDTNSIMPILLALGLFAAITVVALRFYGMVHSRSNYECQQQRYYARHGMWDEILAMPYDGSQTPYTSYRFLALAQKGLLAQDVKLYRPFISYIFENKPKVKKRDQQVYSDIWYACDYMPAARKAAFDTDIVTPGAFNPCETLKLAEINIVYGDYAVAEKLITWLEKTLYYRDQATALRQYLYDDSRVETDPVLGPKRRAIDPENDYLSPKGIMRDLKFVVDKNPDQKTARQFYDAFLILTNQHENP